MTPLTIYKEENGVLTEVFPKYVDGDTFKEEIDHFVDCVRTKQQPVIDGEQGYEMLKMLLGIYESSKKQKEIVF
ncbi:hypothetical protein NC797_01250 [Aquibacillus sp. 3ASR75-11]|uniref:Gfo/Idh/MocA-like oxidoreductase C-terminal domain-containing protein n=1 Tax=Terrihalobacillus insolitus TaxID=2950438 RepID=A0A9X3WQR3_9BACI|nr:hypothetical protein [Terrihalobacillus insolitus]MDC3423133.1 hypothetical protein [Terrihalobacillus insolitus]